MIDDPKDKPHDATEPEDAVSDEQLDEAHGGWGYSLDEGSSSI